MKGNTTAWFTTCAVAKVLQLVAVSRRSCRTTVWPLRFSAAAKTPRFTPGPMVVVLVNGTTVARFAKGAVESLANAVAAKRPATKRNSCHSAALSAGRWRSA